MSSLVKKERDSNMELLRILSMFFVLGLHVNFVAIQGPGTEDVISNGVNAYARLFSEALCIGAVNTFVLISGWFGIKASLKGFFRLVFQCFFIGTLILIGLTIYQHSFEFFSIDSVLLRTDSLWFIYAYIGLFILSPVLNAYLEKANKKELGNVILGFYLLQTTIAWYRGFVGWYSNGYSTLSFIGLYLLAQYIKRYPSFINKLPTGVIFLIAILCVAFNATSAFVFEYLGRADYAGLMFSYLNPLVILSAVSLVLAFSKLKIKSKAINWVASSSLAVYLVHGHPSIFPMYKEMGATLYQNNNGISYWWKILLFLCIVFLFSILLDKIRLFVWNLFQKSK